MSAISKEHASIANFMTAYFKECFVEDCNEIVKIATLRAQEFYLSEDTATVDIFKVLMSKIIEYMHSTLADNMMRSDHKAEGEIENVIKLNVLEVERFILDVTQNTNLQQIIKRTVKDKDASAKVMELIRKGCEIYQKTLNDIYVNASSQEELAFVKDVFNYVMENTNHLFDESVNRSYGRAAPIKCEMHEVSKYVFSSFVE